VTTLLAVLLALSAGFTIGYRTSRPPARIWACARCDDTALTADEQAAFKAIEKYFDPDDPRSNAA
jgi:hypothetical protein